MRFLFLILSIQLQAQVCETSLLCTNGDNKTFLIPCSTIDVSSYYTEHHLEFGDGTDTTFIGIKNQFSLCYQSIVHLYNSGIYIATLNTSFYDSTTNALLCTSSYQDTICNPTLTYINEMNIPYKYKMYDLQGIEILQVPKQKIYIKNRKLYYEL